MKKLYTGQRINEDRVAVMVATLTDTGRAVRSTPLRHHVKHSPTGFEWGYLGSGPADLSRSILIDFLGFEPDAYLVQLLKRRFVSAWGEYWTLSSDQLDAFFESYRNETGVRCLKCLDRGMVGLQYCDCETGQDLDGIDSVASGGSQ